MKAPIPGLLIVAFGLSFFNSVAMGENGTTKENYTVEAASDMLEWIFGLTFALAERLEEPADARDAVNVCAFRYYLLCRGEKAILPPNQEIESALAHQRNIRLSDQELLKDPLQFEGVISDDKIELLAQCGGRAYAISSIEEYEALVDAFHDWLRTLKENR